MKAALSKKQHKDLNALLDAYSLARDRLVEFLADLISEWEEEIGSSSDKWRESEAGQAAQNRIDTAQSWLDEIPDPPWDVDELSGSP